VANKRSSEREPADSLGDKLNVTGGWLPSLTLSLAVNNMKALVLLFSLLVASSLARAIELQPSLTRPLPIIASTFRDATDRRYSVWTDDTQKANDLLRLFEFQKRDLL